MNIVSRYIGGPRGKASGADGHLRSGDFTADRRLLAISGIALVVGALCAVVAVVLLKLIGFFTNLLFFHRLGLAFVRPADSPLGPWMALVPVVGGLIIGLMARYGSDRIRGHGIPEAMEAILIGRSRMEPKVAALKPLSSAISIGSGGPFGAEGPIIMTGGAFGSIIAQFFHLTAAERKTLLVAGAAGGMSATFATPLAACVLAVELLLFEWKPRSVVPVVLASSVAAALRPALLGAGPLFPLHAAGQVGWAGLLDCLALGLAAGACSALLTWGVYTAEDAFGRLPLHWMWWPALGGIAVGLGGLLQPRALGVGYDIIDDLLHGRIVLGVLLSLLLVKAVIWVVALGSGTSGGVLAPLLIMGGCLGALAAPLLPPASVGLWPLVGMAAILGGTMRCPFTAVVFAFELTHDPEIALPLLIACVASYAFTVLVMPRSILTEKVARRGYHLSREYSVDPLEMLTVREAMSRGVVTVSADAPAKELAGRRQYGARANQSHQGYPVLDAQGRLLGMVTRSDLLAASRPEELEGRTVGDLVCRSPVVAFESETCRTAAERMAAEGVGRLPVVSDESPERVVGILTRSDLLKARARYLDLEHRRERLLHTPWRRRRPAPTA